MVAFYLQSSNARNKDALADNRQSDGLPRSFPVGAVYVVEGQGGQYGHLRVSARYLVMPGGQRVDVLSKFGRRTVSLRGAATAHPVNRIITQQTGTVGAKKFALVGGTTGENRRCSMRRAKPPSPSPSITRR